MAIAVHGGLASRGGLRVKRVCAGLLFAAGLCAVGGGLGAFVGERLGESGKSSLPFLVYCAVAVLGGCFLT